MEFGSDWGGKDYDREKKKDIKDDKPKDINDDKQKDIKDDKCKDIEDDIVKEKEDDKTKDIEDDKKKENLNDKHKENNEGKIEKDIKEKEYKEEINDKKLKDVRKEILDNLGDFELQNYYKEFSEEKQMPVNKDSEIRIEFKDYIKVREDISEEVKNRIIEKSEMINDKHIIENFLNDILKTLDKPSELISEYEEIAGMKLNDIAADIMKDNALENIKDSNIKDIAQSLYYNLKENDYPFEDIKKSVAGLIHLSSIISNEEIKKEQLLNISKIESHGAIKDILKCMDTDLIDNMLNDNKLELKDANSFVNIIADHDKNQTIRVVGLPDLALDEIWNNLPPKEKDNQRMKTYFKYKLDNPPLSTIIKYLPESDKYIDYIKGHGMSSIVKIPKKINNDLSYLVGAMRDGGVHYDINNNAYKIHFEQQEKEYLKNEIQPRLERLFGLSTKIELRKDGVHQIQMASKPIYLLFSKLFEARQIQQFWDTPQLIKNAPKQIKKEYIRGFYDAEGTPEHIYHSWFREDKCPPLEFISNVLNDEFEIKTTKPLRIKTNNNYNRYPAYQLFINDYKKFEEEILENI